MRVPTYAAARVWLYFKGERGMEHRSIQQKSFSGGVFCVRVAYLTGKKKEMKRFRFVFWGAWSR